MSIVRAMSVGLLMLALAVQSWPAMAMTHCKDLQGGDGHPVAPVRHDHAAMGQHTVGTASASAGSHAGHHGHQAMVDEGVNADRAHSDTRAADTKVPGCECGCECSGHCAMSCAASAASLNESTAHPMPDGDMLRPAVLRSQTLAAYRLAPLRPPAAAAI